jgi:hypothetical protein
VVLTCVATLRCLKDMSGWDVERIVGKDVKMIYREAVTVTFNTDDLARGASAAVDIPSRKDVIEEFTFLALTSRPLQGNIQEVFSQMTWPYEFRF